MELSGVSKHVLLCNGASCMKKGAEEISNAVRKEIKDRGLSNKIHTTKTLCNRRWVRLLNSKSKNEMIRCVFTPSQF